MLQYGTLVNLPDGQLGIEIVDRQCTRPELERCLWRVESLRPYAYRGTQNELGAEVSLMLGSTHFGVYVPGTYTLAGTGSIARGAVSVEHTPIKPPKVKGDPELRWNNLERRFERERSNGVWVCCEPWAKAPHERVTLGTLAEWFQGAWHFRRQWAHLASIKAPKTVDPVELWKAHINDQKSPPL